MNRPVAGHDLLADLVEVVRDLGDEDDVRRPREPAVQRDEAGIAPHHLEHEDAIVRLRGRVQLVERVERRLHRGVEAERGDRPADVVVDRLRDADDVHPLVAQPLGDRERAVAADGDQRIDAELARTLDEVIRTIDHPERAIRLEEGILERIPAVGGAEDGPAKMADAANGLPSERDDLFLAEEAGVALGDTEDLPAAVERGEDGSADDRIQAGSVAATGGERNSH